MIRHIVLIAIFSSVNILFPMVPSNGSESSDGAQANGTESIKSQSDGTQSIKSQDGDEVSDSSDSVSYIYKGIDGNGEEYETKLNSTIEFFNREPTALLQGKIYSLYTENKDQFKRIHKAYKMYGTGQVFEHNSKTEYIIPIEQSIVDNKGEFVEFFINEQKTKLKPYFIDLLFNKDCVEDLGDKEILGQKCLALKTLLEAKADVNQKSTLDRELKFYDTSTKQFKFYKASMIGLNVGERYIKTHREIIKDNDPIITLCRQKEVTLSDEVKKLLPSLEKYYNESLKNDSETVYPEKNN